MKASSRIRNDDLRGLLEFTNDYAVAKTYLLYGGSKSYRHGKIEIIPVQQFLVEILKYL